MSDINDQCVVWYWRIIQKRYEVGNLQANVLTRLNFLPIGLLKKSINCRPFTVGPNIKSLLVMPFNFIECNYLFMDTFLPKWKLSFSSFKKNYIFNKV